MSTPLFILQLRELKRTMHEAAKVDDFELNMVNWVNKRLDENLNEKPLCGYAACVCGAQAITGRLDLFGSAKDVRCLIDTSSFIATDLDMSCIELTDIDDLAVSIYSADPFSRRQYAAASGFFTEEEIIVFNHLTLDYPSAKDAADYIDAVITKLESKYL